MEQKLRNLEAEDLFIVSTLVSKLGLKELGKIIDKDTLTALMNGENVATNGMAVAFDIAGLIVFNLKNCKDEIYQILSNLSGLEVAEIAKLDAVVPSDELSSR